MIDPRTGEIIKGHVTLGSLRVRQDRLLFEAMGAKGLAGCGIVGVSEEATLAALAREADPVEIALARIRQLSAHEVGHTLGFVHNFAASTWGDRASVMDYPAPRVKITDGEKLDLSDAYAVGIGDWDKWTVRYAYETADQDTDEQFMLTQLIQLAYEQEMTFVSDADARPSAAAHPLGNLWDNGTDPVKELNHLMRVRRISLKNLQPAMLRIEDPMSDFQQLFVPVYLHHRYQVDAVAKMIGGVVYTYDSAGYQIPLSVVADSKQQKALNALLATIEPKELLISDETWENLVPSPFSSYRDVERFSGLTDPVFDRASTARIAADMTIGNLLKPKRISRLAMTADASSTFGARPLMVALVDHVWDRAIAEKREADVSHVIKQSLTEHLLKLSASPDASVAAKTVAKFGVERVKQYLDSITRVASPDRMFAMQMLEEIKRFESRPYPQVEPPQPMPAPPGSPIGNDR